MQDTIGDGTLYLEQKEVFLNLNGNMIKPMFKLHHIHALGVLYDL